MPHSLDMPGPAKNTVKNATARDLKTMSADELTGFSLSLMRTWLAAQRKNPTSESAHTYRTVLENIEREQASRAAA